MPEVDHRVVEANGIHLHVAEAGQGPLVVLLHGFPEGWYSWRHQLAALSAGGFHVVAPDQRGYGRSDAPDTVDAYTMPHLVGDVVGLLAAFEETRAVVVGHDWGASVAWSTALYRPDLVRGVAGLSVPFLPRGSRPPLQAYREILGDRFYQVYFQAPGVAERDLEQDVRRTVRSSLYALSGDAPQLTTMMVGPEGFVAGLAQPAELPRWLSEADLDHFTSEFERSGFRGGLNWYRNLDRNWELSAPWQGARIVPPALYAVGDRDPVYHFPGVRKLAGGSHRFVPNLTRTLVLQGCGHWIQQERPQEMNTALLEFLAGL